MARSLSHPIGEQLSDNCICEVCWKKITDLLHDKVFDKAWDKWWDVKYDEIFDRAYESSVELANAVSRCSKKRFEKIFDSEMDKEVQLEADRSLGPFYDAEFDKALTAEIIQKVFGEHGH